jgi:hypothetical protein
LLALSCSEVRMERANATAKTYPPNLLRSALHHPGSHALCGLFEGVSRCKRWLH